jgi:hypothetical protein
MTKELYEVSYYSDGFLNKTHIGVLSCEFKYLKIEDVFQLCINENTYYIKEKKRFNLFGLDKLIGFIGTDDRLGEMYKYNRITIYFEDATKLDFKLVSDKYYQSGGILN